MDNLGFPTSKDLEWKLVSRKGRPDGIESGTQIRRNLLFSVFVRNLPEVMDYVWLGQIFQKFGPVRDVYISKKRSSKENKRFGFVRFDKKEEALEAVRSMDGVIIRGCKFLVKLASFNSNKFVSSRPASLFRGPVSADRNLDLDKREALLENILIVHRSSLTKIQVKETSDLLQRW